jgi:hypothetical protein
MRLADNRRISLISYLFQYDYDLLTRVRELLRSLGQLCHGSEGVCRRPIRLS